MTTTTTNPVDAMTANRNFVRQASRVFTGLAAAMWAYIAYRLTGDVHLALMVFGAIVFTVSAVKAGVELRMRAIILENRTGG